MSDVLSVRGARKLFGSTEALSGADLTLAEGEWLALLGPNGAGKTTLVRSIAGRVRLDDGVVTLLDVPLDGSPASGRARQQLGVIPQEIALYPLLTAHENLRAFGALNGLSGSALEERVAWAMRWTGLGDRASEPIKRFSGGMKRRLNIACGVLHQPRVVLLDEPTVGVDPQSRQRIWDMLEELRREGASLLLTTHQLDEAQQVSDRIVIIDHGKAIAAGTFEELLADTIGTKRQISLVLDAPPSEPLLARDFEAVEASPGAALGAHTVRRHVDDVATALPGVLADVSAAGGRVVDVRIDAPTLQAVFIHLTGRELRE